MKLNIMNDICGIDYFALTGLLTGMVLIPGATPRAKGRVALQATGLAGWMWILGNRNISLQGQWIEM